MSTLSGENQANKVKKEAIWMVSGDRQETSSSFSGRRATGTQRHGSSDGAAPAWKTAEMIIQFPYGMGCLKRLELH